MQLRQINLPNSDGRQKYLHIYNIQWNESDIQKIEYLKNSHPRYFKILQNINDIKYMLEKNVLHGGYAAFKRYKTSFSYICSNLQITHTLYQCYDCSIYQYITLCSNCFNPFQHEGHNYKMASKSQSLYCQCGLYWRNQVNKVHKCTSSKANTKITISKQEKCIFMAFFSILIKIIISNIQNKLQIQRSIKQQNQVSKENDNDNKKIKQIKEIKSKQTIMHPLVLLYKLFSQLLQQNGDYQQIIIHLLCDKYNKNISNLTKIMNIHLHIFPLQKYINLLMERLIHRKQFVIKIIQTIFQLVNPNLNEDVKFIKSVSVFYHKIHDNYEILNQLATKNIIIYNSYQNTQKQIDTIIQFYFNIRKSYKQNISKDKLIQVWKYFMKHQKFMQRIIQHNLIIQNSQLYKNVYFIFNDCINYPDLFLKIVNYYLNKFSYYTTNSNIIFQYKMFKQFAKSIFIITNGNIEEIFRLLQDCNKQHIKIFIQAYFGSIYTLKQNYKFDLFTAKILWAISSSFHIDFMPLNVPNKITWIQFAIKLKKVIYNLIYKQYMQTVQFLKIAKINNDTNKIEQLQNKLSQWFQQFLFVSQQIPQKQIISLKNKQVIRNQKCKNILKLYTEYDEDKKIFKYIGPQIDADKKFMLINLQTKNQIYGIYYEQKDSLFSNQFRSMMIDNLFNNLIDKIYNGAFYYQNISNQDRQLISLTAVLYDKITNRSNKKLEQYIQKIIKMTSNMEATKNDYIHKLLGISKKKIIQNEEKTPTKTKINIEELKIKLDKINYKINQTFNKRNHKQLTNAQKQNKLNKLQKFKQKFNQNAHKFLQQAKMEQQKIHESQIKCLICKQSINDYGFIYYFFSIKDHPLLSLYSKNAMKQKMIIDSCCHTVHQNCLKANKNKFKCILCSQISNCLVPVLQLCQNSELRNEIIAYWWKTQIKQTFKSQKQTQNKQKNKKESKKQQQSLSQQEIFIKLIKIIVNTLGCGTLLMNNNKKQNKLKYNILFELIKQFYSNSQNDIKQKIKLQLQNENIKIINKFERIINKIITKLLIENFFEQKMQEKIMRESEENINIQKFVWCQLNEIKNEPQMQYSSAVLQNISWLLQIQHQKIIKQFITKSEISAVNLIKQLQLFKHVPKNMLQFNRGLKYCCYRCNKMDYYFCIMCQLFLCNQCSKIAYHIENTSVIKSCICINQSGTVFYQPKHSKFGVIKSSLYYNVYWESYQSHFTNAKQYCLNQEKLFNVFRRIM